TCLGLLGLIGLILVASPAGANDFVWNNTAGGNWNVGGNWAPAGPPSAGDNATIGTAGTYTVTLNDNRSITNLIFNNPTATLDQTAGSTLTLGGALTLTAGTYRLNSGAVSGGSLTTGGGTG